ncbi:uncharacterized protein LOC110033041 [Phalaenopsis equestris]|uniref:uncharacterized protein LOC110033041 n=1 Tax=Phalaenopsis equestris TaxID=78828 RepID=UPI0009E2E430|nr:uncharacterized protein LOC110033041 [Phalaenopsis equestris]
MEKVITLKGTSIPSNSITIAELQQKGLPGILKPIRIRTAKNEEQFRRRNTDQERRWKRSSSWGKNVGRLCDKDGSSGEGASLDSRAAKFLRTVSETLEIRARLLAGQ